MFSLILKIFKKQPAHHPDNEVKQSTEYTFFKKIGENYFEPSLVVATHVSDKATIEEAERQQILRNGGAISYGNIIDIKGDYELTMKAFK